MDKLLKIFAIATTYLLVGFPIAHASVFSFLSGEYEETENFEIMDLFGLFFPPNPDSNERTISFQGSIGDFYCSGPPIEDSNNACHDCGCGVNGPGPDYYCDGTGLPEVWTCRNNPTEANVLASLSPLVFPEYGTNTAGMDFEISSFPDRIDADVIFTDCDIEECKKIDPVSGIPDPDGCSASCVPSCDTGQLQSDTDTYSNHCSLDFTIDEHDPLFFYKLTPRLDLTIGFSQPQTHPDIEISKIMNSVDFMPHYCGDGNPNAGETSSNCCFDLGCADGEFCDTPDPSARPQSGSCKPESGINLEVTVSERDFFDATKPHTTSFEAVVQDIPSGFSVSEQRLCSFHSIDGDTVACESIGIQVTNCEENYGNSYSLNCELVFPPIGLDSPFFDSSQDKIILAGGELKLSASFTDSLNTIHKELISDMGDFFMDVQTTCPDGTCGFDEGFGQTNECPADCNCPGGQILLEDANGGRGACIEPESAGLQITGIDPNPVPCVMTMDGMDLNQLGPGASLTQGACKPDPINLYSIITGIPGEVELIKSQYIIEGVSYDVLCHPTIATNEFKCPVTLKTIQGSSDQQDIELVMDIAYSGVTTTGAIIDSVTGRVTGGATVQISNSVGSQESLQTGFELAQPLLQLLSCQEEEERIKSKIDGLKSKESKLLAIVGVLAGITTTACVACAASLGSGSDIESSYKNEIRTGIGGIHFGNMGYEDDISNYSTANFLMPMSGLGGAAPGGSVSCSICKIGVPLTACVSSPLLFGVSGIEDKMGDLKENKNSACAATGTGGLSSSHNSAGGTLAKVGGAVAGIVCLIFAAKGIAHIANSLQAGTAGASGLSGVGDFPLGGPGGAAPDFGAPSSLPTYA